MRTTFFVNTEDVSVSQCSAKRPENKIRTGEATKIKCAAHPFAFFLVCFLCRYATSSSISPILNGKYHSATKRRKNNTGFYYGLRDDHILCSSSASSTCTLNSLRPSSPLLWKPALDGLTSTLQSLQYRITSIARERVDWMQDKNQRQNRVGEAENNALELNPSLCQYQQQMETSEKDHSKGSPTILERLDSHFSSEFLREKILHNLSRSIQLIITNQQRNHQGLYSRADDTFNNVESNIILDKAMSLLGRGGSMSHHCQQQHDQYEDNSVIGVSTTTKSKRSKKKKKRQNNTGFYYGIREDVIMIPDYVTKEKEGGTASNEEKRSKAPHLLQPKERRTLTPPQNDQRDDEDQKEKQRQSSSPKLNEKKKREKKKTSSSSHGGVPSEMSNVLGETMLELREMREEIISLREELRAMKAKLREEDREEEERTTDEPQQFDDNVEEEAAEPSELPEKSQRSRKRDFDRISKEVEKWAVNILFEEERTGNGWKEISCNNLMRKKFNKDGRTQVYLKWMADTRDEHDRESGISDKNNLDYPCIKCYSTIDAPMDTVCSFLSNKDTIPLYNELIEDHDDVEEITPHSKITWTKICKILFVKPRDFVTFCSHRWWRDGTQVIINQACEHEGRPGLMEEGQGDATRGFALRGANFISKDPNDPNKTRITILAHANPGGGLPQWAMNTAVNGVVQIEPFKLFHKINEGACSYKEKSSASSQTAHVSSLPGRSTTPAGIAQLGYTCFWPNGGGLKESNPFSSHPRQTWDDSEGCNEDE